MVDTVYSSSSQYFVCNREQTCGMAEIMNSLVVSVGEKRKMYECYIRNVGPHSDNAVVETTREGIYSIASSVVFVSSVL